jgi:hypothetical protein
MEEVGAVLRRGLSVLCSFGGLEYCGVGAPFGLSLHTNSALRPTAKPEEVSPPTTSRSSINMVLLCVC